MRNLIHMLGTQFLSWPCMKTIYKHPHMPSDFSIIATYNTHNPIKTPTFFLSLKSSFPYLLSLSPFYSLTLSLSRAKQWVYCQEKLLATLMAKILRTFWVGRNTRRTLTTTSRTQTALSRWVSQKIR